MVFLSLFYLNMLNMFEYIQIQKKIHNQILNEYILIKNIVTWYFSTLYLKHAPDIWSMITIKFITFK